MSQKRKSSKSTRYSNRLGILGIIAVVAMMGVVLFTQISAKEKELSGFKKNENSLLQKYDSEVSRAEQLEEKRVYVKTKKYIEEVAKQLGLVYPNEVIYKPKN